MKLGDYKRAMRPKKYLNSNFIVYDGAVEEDREEFGIGGAVSVLPEAYNTVKKATDFIQSSDITPAKAKKVVLDFFKQRKPYSGANQQKDFTPEKNFLSVLKGYMNKFNPTLSGASRDLGINRNLIRGIQDRINLQETGQRSSNLGF